MLLTNSAEGITPSGTNVTTGNSGGASGNAWDLVTATGGTAGIITSDSAHAAHGSLGYNLSIGVTAAECYLQWLASLGGSFATLYSRAYVYLTAAPPVNHKLIRFLTTNVTNGGAVVTSTGKLAVIDAASTVIATTTNTLPLNRLFRVEFDSTASATVGTLVARLYANADDTTPLETLTSTAQNTGAGPMNQVRYGPTGGTVASIGPFWLDDLGITDVGPMGPSAGGGGPLPQPGGRAWRRLYRRPQTAWQIPAVTAAAAPVQAVRQPQIPRRAAARARLGGRGLCAAGILATGIGPPPVPAPHQPPAITHPAPHRAQWHGGRGAVPAAVPQPTRPVMVYRRAPHRAQWVRPQPGSPPAALPQPFKPGTIYPRTPHRALWRSGTGPLAAQATLQPSRPVTVYRRTAHRALWRSGSGPVAIPGTLQPFRPPAVFSRPQHRALWRGIAGPVAAAVSPPQARPATVCRRTPHGAIWRAIRGTPPAATPQPFKPPTVFRRAPHRAAWQQARGAAPAARRQPFTPATIWARAAHRALWRAIAGPPAPPSAAVQNATSTAAVTAQVTSGPAVTAVTGSAAAVTDPRDGTAAVTTGGTYDPYLDAYTDSYPGFRGAASTAAVTQPGTSQPDVSGG